jgi:hypothetical protein
MNCSNVKEREDRRKRRRGMRTGQKIKEMEKVYV